MNDHGSHPSSEEPTGAGTAEPAGTTDIADIWVSAPGKVMLAGEYAVLEGTDAVVMAVDRRVVARALPAAASSGPFLKAVRDIVTAHAGAASAEALAAAHLFVDSQSLRTPEGTKLGLGSSAAVTVAACACALAHGPALDPSGALAPTLVHRLAHAAHGAAQAHRGARGSGADIAAAVHGGIIAVRMRPDPEELPVVRPLSPGGGAAPAAGDGNLGGAHLVFLWTGSSASTTDLVARVQAWRHAHPAAYDQATRAIADAAAALIASLRPGAGAEEVVAALDQGGRAVAGLSRAAGVEIETPIHREIATLARACGRGAAKPTGAGGGDIAIAAFATAEQAEAFRGQATARGMNLLDLSCAHEGVTVSSRPGTGPGAHEGL